MPYSDWHYTTSYSLPFSQILRAFYPSPLMPSEWIAPKKLIRESMEKFFSEGLDDVHKKIKVYPNNKEWNDFFIEDFMINFCKFFYNYDIGYETGEQFCLALDSYLSRKLPIYSRYWRMLIENNLDSDAKSSNWQNNNSETISRQLTEQDTTQYNTHDETQDTTGTLDSETTTHSTNDTETKSRSRAGVSDTPQTELDLNLDNIDYATSVNVSDSVGSSVATSDSDSKTHQTTTGHLTDHATDHTIGHLDSEVDTDSKTFGQLIGGGESRNQNIMTLAQLFSQSEIDFYTALFLDILNNQIFSPLF